MTANTLQDFMKEEDTLFDSFGSNSRTFSNGQTMSVNDIFSRPIDLGPDESPTSTSFSPDEQLFHEKRKSDGLSNSNHPSKSIKPDPLAAQQPQRVAKKPGRKQDPNEPENKRKAQNRAAQRAFRERKERHLKDLEDRVSELEKEAAATNNENEFLRQQVQRLQSELKKYRNSRFDQNSVALDISDTSSKSFTFEFPFFSGDANKQQPSGSMQQTSTAARSSGAAALNISPNTCPLDRSSSSAQSPTSVGSASSLAPSQRRSTGGSPSSAVSSPFSFREVSSSHSTPLSLRDVVSKSGEVAATETFCDKLSQACGSKENPLSAAVAADIARSGQSPVVITAGSALPWTSPVNTTKDLNKTPPSSSVFSPNSFELDFLGEYRDPLFDGEEFSLPELPTAEYSLFDPLENPIANATFESMKEKSSTPASGLIEADSQSTVNDEDTVPAPNKMMNCSAVWDRICSHPKFGDIDIDGLCYELRSKAKCSDSGVLLTEKDVNKVLEKFR